MIEGKKASTLLILKVLEEYSDENHYLTETNFDTDEFVLKSNQVVLIKA